MVDIDLTIATDNDFKPSLFDVHKILNEEVVGENESRMSLFTNFILGEKDVMMSGPRSSGKTWITDHVVSFVGLLGKDENGQCYKLTSGSEKSTWYEAENLDKCKYVVVLELNKITTTARETLKDWGEGKDSEYKTTAQIGGSRRVQVKKLKRRPFVFCLADEDELKTDAQLASRLTVIRTDNSITQNKNIMKHQAMLERLPENPMKVDTIKKNKVSEHIKTLPPLQKYLWKNPAADLFVDCIPPFFTDCRRDFPKYVANAIGICRFYWKERIKTAIGDKEAYFVTPQDMFLNHIIYGTTLVSSALKCNNIEREIMKILQMSSEPLKRPAIQKELKKTGTTLSSNMLSRHLNSLSNLGYIDKDQSKDNKRMLEYSIGQMFQDFAFQINWKEIIEKTKETMRELYPFIAEEYIEKYCNNPIVIHPFTGEEINLNEIEVEKVSTHLGQSKVFDEAREQKEAEKKEKKTAEEIDGLFEGAEEFQQMEIIEEEVIE